MRENGWLEEEFRAANKRVREWPEWKKEIEAKKSSLAIKEPPLTQSAKAASASSKNE